MLQNKTFNVSLKYTRDFRVLSFFDLHNYTSYDVQKGMFNFILLTTK